MYNKHFLRQYMSKQSAYSPKNLLISTPADSPPHKAPHTPRVSSYCHKLFSLFLSKIPTTRITSWGVW